MRMGRMARSMSAPEDRPPGVSGFSVVVRLMAYVRPYRALASVSVLAMLVHSATVVATPWIIYRIVDSVITSPNSSDLALYAFLLGANALLGYVTNYLHLLTLSRIGQNLLLGLRTATFDHLQTMSLSYFGPDRGGEQHVPRPERRPAAARVPGHLRPGAGGPAGAGRHHRGHAPAEVGASPGNPGRNTGAGGRAGLLAAVRLALFHGGAEGHGHGELGAPRRTSPGCALSRASTVRARTSGPSTTPARSTWTRASGPAASPRP